MAYNPIVHKLTSSLDYKDQSIVFVNDDVSGDIDIQEVLSGSSSNVAINIKESTIEFTGTLDSNNSFENKNAVIFENANKGVKFKGESDPLFSLDESSVLNISAKDELCVNKDTKFNKVVVDELTGSLINVDNSFNRFLKAGKGYFPEIVTSPSGVQRWEIKAKPDMTFSFINLNDLLSKNASGEFYLNHNTNNAINTTFTKSNGDVVVYDRSNINGETQILGGQTVTTPSAGALHIRRVNINKNFIYNPPESYLYPGTGATTDYADYYTYDLSRLSQNLRESFLNSLVHTVVIIGKRFLPKVRIGSKATVDTSVKKIFFMFRPWFPEIEKGMTFVFARVLTPFDQSLGRSALIDDHLGRGKVWYSASGTPGFLREDGYAFRVNVPLADSGGRWSVTSHTGDGVTIDHKWPEELGGAGNVNSLDSSGRSAKTFASTTEVIRYQGDGVWKRIDDINH